MHPFMLTAEAVTHQTYAALLGMAGRSPADRERRSMDERDRGAVSLEQVLWFAAAGISVAVIATILWNQIRDTANTPVAPPAAPNPNG